jgi:sugar lactone lactonase YvrE
MADNHAGRRQCRGSGYPGKRFAFLKQKDPMAKPFLFLLGCITFFMTGSAQSLHPLVPVDSFGRSQVLGLAVTPAGNRIFVSFPHREPFSCFLEEITGGKRIPFPDREWNKYLPESPDDHFLNVQALYADENDCLWVLDSAPGGGGVPKGGSPGKGRFKLLRIDLRDNKVKRIYRFEDLPRDRSALNDVNIDNQRQLAYLSDPGLSAIVVLDLKTGKSRVLLQKDASTVAVPGVKLHIDGVDVQDANGRPFVSNVNGIALTKNNQYFYFRAINQTRLYRIAARFLADTLLKPSELSARVELVAETGICHGMAADAKGNIYLSNSPEHAIQYVSPDGRVHVLARDERLIWPDSFGIGSDGYIYISCSQINRLPGYNNGVDKVEYPFSIYKIQKP